MISTAPLFSLPNLLLYPGAKLPVYFSESRHLKMLHELSKSGKELLVGGLLKGDWEENYFENPDVHPIAGLGRFQVPPSFSGEKPIHLLGIGVGRVRILQVRRDKAFPEAEYETLPETEIPEEQSQTIRQQLIDGISFVANGKAIVDDSATLPWITDVLCLALPISVERKYEIFSTLDIQKRAQSALAEVVQLKKERSSLEDLDMDKEHPDSN
ncbi:MAG: LON peptidase substrate-binding domain-containing protein [Planctomycetota bacterium]|jgi:ATP-dependent Lon protease|nr:LON peptidase substrate-binding domain-containing protein [Planctomycetota bacterium]